MIQWVENSNYLYGYTYNVDLTNKKIAGFDLDDTLIKVKSNSKFSKDSDDWILYNENVVDELKKLINKNYHLVIISNQLGISKGKVDINTFKEKLGKIIKHIGLNFHVYCAIKDDHFRKPRMGIWDIISGDKSNSFYVGDAGGLDKRTINNAQINKDFSDTDLKFAHNVGIKFIHRDEFIFNVKYDCINIKYPVIFNDICKSHTYNFAPKTNEIILNIGFPASGKTHFTKKYIMQHNYSYINQDTLKTQKKCLAETEKALKTKQNIVIDNTNLTIEHRKVFIELAKKYKYTVRCFIFTTPIEICIHNSYYRNYISNGQIKTIPAIVYNMVRKKYIEPTKNEGISEIIKIDFAFNADNNEIYSKYYH